MASRSLASGVVQATYTLTAPLPYVGWGNVNLVPERVVYSSSNMPVENWQARNVGAQPITVEVSSPQVFATEWMQSVAQRLQSLEQGNAERDEPRVRNVVAQMLRIACGAETFQPSSSTRFARLGTQNPSIQQLAHAIGVTPQKLVEQADAVLDRRNAVAHPGSLSGLHREVAAVRMLISPAHEQLYGWECKFIQHYEQLKEAFADKFKEHHDGASNQQGTRQV